MNVRYLYLGFIVLAAMFVSQGNAQVSAQGGSPNSQAEKKPAAAKVTNIHVDDGQRIFEQNCSRCHNAPEGFSPRISGTIVRHMRVRASLSAHDEQELMRFLNPQ